MHQVHDRDGHSHQHAIIHADFLSTAAQDHRDAQQNSIAVDSGSSWVFSQSSLSALLSRTVDSQITSLAKSPECLFVDPAVGEARLVLFAHVFNREHPPAVRPVLLAPNAPRSPPRLA